MCRTSATYAQRSHARTMHTLAKLLELWAIPQKNTEIRKGIHPGEFPTYMSYPLGLIFAKVLYDRRMAPKSCACLKTTLKRMNQWCFLCHTQWRSTHAELERVWAWCQTRMTIKWKCCNRPRKLARRCGSAMHPTFATLIWETGQNRKHIREWCMQMTLMMRHVIDPLMKDDKCAMYAWA